MSIESRFLVVTTALNRAEFRWKWLRFFERSFLLGIILCVLGLMIEAAILGGWITSKSGAIAAFATVGILGFVAEVVILIVVAATGANRNRLAAAIERVNPRMLDRLNTLLSLESQPSHWRSESFARRIAGQTRLLVTEKSATPAFSGRAALQYMTAFLAAALVTALVFHRYSPWKRLLAADAARVAGAPHDDSALDIALPATNSLEQEPAWGEVRITDPGSDLKVTKVDVVPMQIEAAANQALTNVEWFSTINGEGESQHNLPQPSEPRFAVYQPSVYLDELQLADWDVMTYYAKARTEKENSYASEVYFMEVRPFREDILKMPGGENGQAYQTLKKLSALIGRQQHVIRQTHQHVQKPQPQENLQDQDRKKISDAESELGESTAHLYAEMASEMENKPIGEALDSLAKAEEKLKSATEKLDARETGDAQKHERNALTDLVAARKMFQKAVSEHPEDFEEPPDEPSQPPPDASQRLAQMAEFRNEARASQEFVQKTLEKQTRLEQQARTAPRSEYPAMAGQEKELRQGLEEFEQQHPQVFKGAQDQQASASQAMTEAEKSLENKNSNARASMQQATQKLSDLSQAMRNRSAEQQLADAYKLKEMLDRQIQTFSQGANTNPAAGEAVPDKTMEETANQARQTVNQLRSVAEQEPTRDAFGQPLRDSLSGQNKIDLDSKLNRIERPRTLDDAQDRGSLAERAADARDALAKVSQAFEASQPKTLQATRKEDPLKSGGQESFDRGMSELDSLVKQLEKDQPPSRQDQDKQGKEALFNLQMGLRELSGNQQGNQYVVRLEEILKGEKLEIADLKKLMEELQHFSVETTDHLAKHDEPPDMTHVDPSRLPPAYRGRIQKYFQKLSEK